MEIKRRIGLPRMSFHVMNRGARKVSIFAGDADRSLFVSLLGRFATKYDVRITSWCLMPNHYHLEPTAEGTPLSLMMRDLDGTYARAFNDRHDTTGCLFQGPFKSMAIEYDEGLLFVSRYIHRNPDDLREAPKSYRWSSCRSYIGLEPSPEWLDTSRVLAQVRDASMSDGEAYLRYLQAAPPKRKRRATPKKSADGFHLEWIRFLEERSSERLLGLEGLLDRTALSTIVAWAARRIYGIPAAAISEYFGYRSVAAVYAIASRFQRRLSEEPDLEQALQVLRFLRRRNLSS
jgi:REP element-mobilizing transposase RayT